MYSIGFVALIVARFASIVFVAPLNRGALAIPLVYRLVPVAILAVLNLWGLYSVLRYFGVLRALGLDHFDQSARERGLVTSGAYRYTKNVMYLLILPVFCVPGLLWGSVTATLLGVFHYAYVWVHYYCTERPDMALIYGEPQN